MYLVMGAYSPNNEHNQKTPIARVILTVGVFFVLRLDQLIANNRNDSVDV
ncbi:hypothetical protein [Streptococcus jiangjianxini]